MGNANVSVIIPVYNLASWLSKSIDSVLAQTYSDFEIIAVDDGSVDNSAEILKRYAESDERIKPIFKANGGVSSARNVGLDAAVGEYVFFLDGDDWIVPDTLEKLINLSDEFDVVQAAFTEVYDDGSEKFPDDVSFVNREIANTEEMLCCYFRSVIQESCWNKLYKKSFIGDLRFDENLSVAEDSDFVYRLLKKAGKVKLIKDVTYKYYIRHDSCMQAGIKEKHFGIMSLRERQMADVRTDSVVFKSFIYRYSKDVFYIMHGILTDSENEFKDRLPTLRKKLLGNKKNILFSKYLNLHFKIGFIILWLFPVLFYKIYSK